MKENKNHGKGANYSSDPDLIILIALTNQTQQAREAQQQKIMCVHEEKGLRRSYL